MDLTEFLAARLDEDVAAAKAVKDGSEPWPGQWQARDRHALETYNGWVIALAPGVHDSRDPRSVAAAEFAPGVVEHMARHDPARVLREVAAKRAIIAAHGPDRIGKFGSPENPRCLVCLTDRDGYEEQWEADPWPCLTLRALAVVYSDHPDYRDEWKP